MTKKDLGYVHFGTHGLAEADANLPGQVGLYVHENRHPDRADAIFAFMTADQALELATQLIAAARETESAAYAAEHSEHCSPAKPEAVALEL
jgi:hypothetical protein